MIAQWVWQTVGEPSPTPHWDSFTTSQICCREIRALWKKTGDVDLLEGACVWNQNSRNSKQMEAGPILRQKKESALTVQLLGAVFRSEFSSCEPVTCSQRRCTWQQQIADSVFQRRRSQRSVDASFSPFFDLISKQTTTLLGTLSVLVQRLSWSFQEMYFVLMYCACTHSGP